MTRPDTHNPNRSVPQTIALAGGVLALTAVVMVVFLSVGWPARKRPALDVFEAYDHQTMRRAMSPQAVEIGRAHV